LIVGNIVPALCIASSPWTVATSQITPLTHTSFGII